MKGQTYMDIFDNDSISSSPLLRVARDHAAARRGRWAEMVTHAARYLTPTILARATALTPDFISDAAAYAVQRGTRSAAEPTETMAAALLYLALVGKSGDDALLIDNSLRFSTASGGGGLVLAQNSGGAFTAWQGGREVSTFRSDTPAQVYEVVSRLLAH